METFDITSAMKLIDLRPPIPGYERFIGAYLLRGDQMAVVDVGPRAAVPNLLTALKEQNVSPEEIDFIILTHIHIDHGGGVGMAARKMSRAKIIAHGRARSHLIDPTRLWQASVDTLGDLAHQYGEIEPVPEDRIVEAVDEMRLDLGDGLVLEIYLTPGHAPHHLSIFERANGVLIAGEAAGVCIDGTVRPATPPPFRLQVSLASIDRLTELKPRKICFGHFGCYDDACEKLELARQKLLDWYEIISTAARAGRGAEDILAVLREKDTSFDYLDGLSSDSYGREHSLLMNSIRGMSQAASVSGGAAGLLRS